jgi:catechol 2,3-dioxygenase-like lactoylglutathione lyase family enzyme
MTAARLEHANFTVSDLDKTAAWMADVFGWRIRWQGSAIHDGTTYHVGGDDSYVAIYRPKGEVIDSPSSYGTRGGLNHIGVVVEDLDAAEARVIAAGFMPRSHADYEPGKRFYFDDHDGIEFEVISYS